MSATTLHRPTHRETLWALEAAFDRGDVVTVFGECTVEYDGRAESDLGLGARLLVLKPDGAALVHTDEGRTPVNWQPPGSEHRGAVRDGRLRVRSVRENPDERLDVRFERVEQFVAMSITGGREVAVRGSEEDLRRRILDEPSLVGQGFEPLATERETPAGPVDVFGRDAESHPVVVELKRRRVGPSAVGQLGRYVDALGEEFPDEPIRGVLVAPSVTDRAAERLADRGLDHVALDPPREGVDRGGRDDRGEGEEEGESGDADVDGAAGLDAGADADPDAESG